MSVIQKNSLFYIILSTRKLFSEAPATDVACTIITVLQYGDKGKTTWTLGRAIIGKKNSTEINHTKFNIHTHQP